MRQKLIGVWRKITQIKILTPFIICIRYFAGTNLFNTILDFVETAILHTSYEETLKFMHDNKKKIRNIEQSLEDQKSRIIYCNICKYRSTHNRKYIKGMVDKEQYFDKEILCLENKEGFIDCGAYKGDTIQAFKKNIGNDKKYEFIIALEPDAHNFKQLKKNCKKKRIERVEILNVGSWNKKGIMRFRGNTEEACMLSEEGDVKVQVDTIDNIARGKNVTFIKFDVEGAELKSLQGAEATIKRTHPKLAISIYHSDSDMIDIAEYIMQNYPFYKLYVRHYTYFYADTVLYAIDRNI